MAPRGIPASSLHGSGGTLHSEARAAAAQNLDGWIRARADYDNLSRRMIEERQHARSEGMQEALQSLARVMEYVDAACANIPAELSGHPWVEGVRQIRSAFTKELTLAGVQEIADANVLFDPTMHESVAEVHSDLPPGHVVAIVRRGYRVGNRVLQPAKVQLSGARLGEVLKPETAVAPHGAVATPSTSVTRKQKKE